MKYWLPFTWSAWWCVSITITPSSPTIIPALLTLTLSRPGPPPWMYACTFGASSLSSVFQLGT